MSRREEGVKLLGEQADSDSDDEVLFHTSSITAPPQPPQSGPQDDPPPSYTAPQAATLTPTPFTDHHPSPQASATPMATPMTAAVPVPMDEAPPDYFQHEPKVVGEKAGLAVQIQIDGRLVPGTVMEDASGRHMVYVCQPQAAPNSSDRPPPPKDYFLLSIISLLCCCAPIGIVALIKSLEVQRLYRRGDYAGAQRASRQAQSWASAAIIFSVTVIVVVFALKLYFTEFEQRRYYQY